MPLITLDHIQMAFGHLPLLDDASLLVEPGERVAIIGRNGTGKSTLMKILSGELEPDAGTIWRAPDLVAARLGQDVALATPLPVFDVVAEGLSGLGQLVADYHHAAKAVADGGGDAALAELGRLQHDLEERDGWTVEQRVEGVLEKLSLPADALVTTLSGGWRRRVLLARALVAEPSLLLLDEPTNHLDLEAIDWLEDHLKNYAGAIVFVTHDRAFLQRLATRIIELDRGRVTSWPGDYRTFLDKKDAWLANEALADAKFDKRLAQEEVWLRRGVKARRTRDEGRVKALMRMREARAARRNQIGNVRLAVDVADRTGAVVFDVEHINKTYGDRMIVSDFSTRIMRGDRIGVIGPNGSGKTTLLRMLVGDLAPDGGEVHRGTNVQVAYFDQERAQLDPERTVVDSVADGSDTVIVGGAPRHVHGYLEDFLFAPERARSQVKALSGGERNRLLLARLLTQPANVLVLDEPTNDLDIETLELVEAMLADFPGTILVVSHDRTFLNHVVTSTIVMEPGGRVAEYVGDYDDWARQRAVAQGAPTKGTKLAESTKADAAAAKPTAPKHAGPAKAEPASPKLAERAKAEPASPKHAGPAKAEPASPKLAERAKAGKKITFNERREFDALPDRIAALEAEDARLKAAIAEPGFYKEARAAIAKTLARVESVKAELETAYARWDELDSRGR